MSQSDKRHRHTLIFRQGVDHWRAQGNVLREGSSMSSLLLNYLAIAVRLPADSEAPTQWLASCDIAPLITRVLDLAQVLLDESRVGKRTTRAVASTYTYLVFAHMAWAIGDWSLGERVVRLASRPQVIERATPFWAEYRRAMLALVNAKRYRPKKLQTRGLEVYWNAYLPLFAALAQNKPLDAALTDIAVQFARRNTDRRLRSDAHGIEGTGNDPVAWDFRQHAILAYAQRAAPLQFDGAR